VIGAPKPRSLALPATVRLMKGAVDAADLLSAALANRDIGLEQI